MSDQYKDIAEMAGKAFAEHRISKGPGYSWRVGRARTGSYAFRVTWAPGVLMVSGDLGHATFSVWPSFDNPWRAAKFVLGCDFDYLMGKSNLKREFDRDRTVRAVLRCADDQQRFGESGIWEEIVKKWGWGWNENFRNGAVQMKAAARMRDELASETQACELFPDYDAPIMRSWPPQGRWIYEALLLWGRMAVRQEPIWSRASRGWAAFLSELRSYKRYPVLRPERLYKRLSGGYPGELWRKTEVSMRSVRAWRVAGLDLSRFGFYRDAGSNWPLRSGADGFQPVEA